MLMILESKYSFMILVTKAGLEERGPHGEQVVSALLFTSVSWWCTSKL